MEAKDTLQGLTVVTGRLDHIPYGAVGVGFDRSHRLSCGYRADQKDGGGQHGVAELHVETHGPHCTLSSPGTIVRISRPYPSGEPSRPTTKGTAITT